MCTKGLFLSVWICVSVTTICLTQCNTSPSHRVDQVVDCDLCNVGPLLFNVCVKLLDIGRNWNTLSYTSIQSIQTCHTMGDMSSEYEFGYANRLLQHLSGWLVSGDLGGEDAGCGGSWAGVITRGLWLWGRLDVLPNSLKHLWRWLMVEKWTLNSRATALVDIPAVSMPITRSLKHVTSVALCCVIKRHILKWPFTVVSLRHTCVIIMLSNHHLDMTHLWGGWLSRSLTQI